MKKNKRFYLVSLGCPKNRVDAERILSVMSTGGYSYTDDPESAGTIIINTCAFIEPAVEESVDTILDVRSEFPAAFLVVAGCLPLRYKEDLKQSMPEANLFLTPDRIGELPELLADRPSPRIAPGLAAGSGRILTTPGYAYLKIAEGCSKKCSYCTIPSIRGPLTSRDCEELEQEAAFLASGGVRELVLVAQDTTAYGVDRGEKNALLRLLERLTTLDGIKWIRLMYLHPQGVSREMHTIIRDSDKILPYLDIPFQHISDVVLKSMGRPWKGDRIRRLVETLRKEIPDLVLRTTLMVGFPTEQDKHFQELRNFVEAYEIEHVGVFPYSPEEGTRAFHLGDPLPAEEKQARADELRSIHSRFMEKRLASKVGSIHQSLIEGISEESELLLQGRTWDQAPEVDGVLYITSGHAVAGAIHQVRITGFHGTDLFGEID
ncbi:MAG: 30S ribosomal protein S12 methylthiotransferase RimO [Desulfomonile tiedjei]|uniref:Ribosomal protein uS12 methylthiotransferase RimO n=1 Tax=Desulfomonile tiedjei TaxID=2358 RepID=A0A9D6V1H0_9BACT|nr:30S ribosomal protein S12 methylthiotransferase RimO [Desulfomonile tiedjei]